jgi:tRNA (guanosine-2'-O-)-methyltransferase
MTAVREQTRYMTRRAFRNLTRADYPTAPRHSVRLVTYATDPANIGGMVRTAEAFMADRLTALKSPGATAVGTDRWQPAEYGWHLVEAIAAAKADGYTIVALEQATDAHRLPCDLPERMCLVSGNEGSGIPASVLSAADLAIEIPQYGFVGSLNVVTATSIALYEWASQWARPR